MKLNNAISTSKRITIQVQEELDYISGISEPILFECVSATSRILASPLLLKNHHSTATAWLNKVGKNKKKIFRNNSTRNEGQTSTKAYQFYIMFSKHDLILKHYLFYYLNYEKSGK